MHKLWKQWIMKTIVDCAQLYIDLSLYYTGHYNLDQLTIAFRKTRLKQARTAILWSLVSKLVWLNIHFQLYTQCMWAATDLVGPLMTTVKPGCSCIYDRNHQFNETSLLAWQLKKTNMAYNFVKLFFSTYPSPSCWWCLTVRRSSWSFP